MGIGASIWGINSLTPLSSLGGRDFGAYYRLHRAMSILTFTWMLEVVFN